MCGASCATVSITKIRLPQAYSGASQRIAHPTPAKGSATLVIGAPPRGPPRCRELLTPSGEAKPISPFQRPRAQPRTCEDFDGHLRGAHQRAVRRRSSVLRVAAPLGGSGVGERGADEVLRPGPPEIACVAPAPGMRRLMIACRRSLRVPHNEGKLSSPEKRER